MFVKILGSAAGGGFPQWNCACRNCFGVRNGAVTAKSRGQLQVAISEDQKSWFLLNASPDIRLQIEQFPSLQPKRGMRETPIAGIVLTSGDLDQVLGLLALREFQGFCVYSTPSIQRILRDDNTIFSMLNRLPKQVDWRDIAPEGTFELEACDGESSGLRCSTFSLSGNSTSCYPKYVPAERSSELATGEALLGLTIEGTSRKRLGYFPSVPKLDHEFLERLSKLSLDVLLFDGTFWTNEELQQVLDGAPTAEAIGHVPISGRNGSLHALDNLAIKRRIYVHMNNTNPMLDESGPQYSEALAAGWEVAEDGWQFNL
ncbi:MAG: pyrroloquinoline quinone biosynthesis protein PqqB [Acidobacteriota bacterium]|nr:pyrroloquinoline quinone biosynthesis protein PqqB [Acidobacteriota bacterium]